MGDICNKAEELCCDAPEPKEQLINIVDIKVRINNKEVIVRPEDFEDQDCWFLRRAMHDEKMLAAALNKLTRN